MDNIFMDSENSKTSDSARLIFNDTDEINFRRSNKYVDFSNFRI